MNYILKNENAVYYECGFSCDNEVFLKLGDEAFFITDSRYYLEAKEYIEGATVIEGDRRDLFLSVKEILDKHKIKSLSYDPLEWSVFEFEKFSENQQDISFEKVVNFSQKKRIIKSQEEQEILKEAALLGKKAFSKFLDFLLQKGEGLDEKRLHFEAESIFKNYGELDLSFSPIVAIEENSAKPHSLPTDKTLKRDDLILLDAGVKYKRYCSDRTRTSSVGEYLSFEKDVVFKDGFKQKIYDIVRFAQEASLKTAKAGVKASDIDKAAREVIDKAGYGKYFIHSIGHGVGLDIHELPVIGQRSEDIIEEGMVFTIEPGIYLPDRFGVRIEDTVIAREDFVEVIG